MDDRCTVTLCRKKEIPILLRLLFLLKQNFFFSSQTYILLNSIIMQRVCHTLFDKTDSIVINNEMTTGRLQQKEKKNYKHRTRERK